MFFCVFVGVRWSATHTSLRKSSSTTATLRASLWRLTVPWAPLKDPGQSACLSHYQHTDSSIAFASKVGRGFFLCFILKQKKAKSSVIFSTVMPVTFSVRSVSACDRCSSYSETLEHHVRRRLTIGLSVLVELLSDNLERTQRSFMVTPLREPQRFREWIMYLNGLQRQKKIFLNYHVIFVFLRFCSSQFHKTLVAEISTFALI